MSRSASLAPLHRVMSRLAGAHPEPYALYYVAFGLRKIHAALPACTPSRAFIVSWTVSSASDRCAVMSFSR